MKRVKAHPLTWGWALLILGVWWTLVWIAVGGTLPQPTGDLAYEGDSLAGLALRQHSTLEVTLHLHDGPPTQFHGVRWADGAVMFNANGYAWVEVGGERVYPMQRWPHIQPDVNRVWLSVRAHTLHVRINDEVLWAGEVNDLPFNSFAAGCDDIVTLERVRYWR